MGTDIYSSRGVIVEVDDFLKVINGKSKSDVVEVCLGFHQDLVVDVRQNPDDEWRIEKSIFFRALGGLKKSMKLSEIREIVASVVTVGGEVAKYGDCWVEHSEDVQDLFTKILDACPHANDLPYIMEVTAWGSGRNNGWDVPFGVACVVFDSESCYERTLSDQGRAVEKTFGHCRQGSRKNFWAL
jgi:hypothetical protein